MPPPLLMIREYAMVRPIRQKRLIYEVELPRGRRQPRPWREKTQRDHNPNDNSTKNSQEGYPRGYSWDKTSTCGSFS